MMRVVKHGYRLSRKVVDDPFLATFWVMLDNTVGTLVQKTFKKSFSTQNILFGTIQRLVSDSVSWWDQSLISSVHRQQLEGNCSKDSWSEEPAGVLKSIFQFHIQWGFVWFFFSFVHYHVEAELCQFLSHVALATPKTVLTNILSLQDSDFLMLLGTKVPNHPEFH